MHIRLNLSKAVSYEKDILNSKEYLLLALQRLSNYRKLRGEELNKKADVRDTLKEVHKLLERIGKNLPIMAGEERKKALKAELEAEKGEGLETEAPKISGVSEEGYDMTSLEGELLEIKRKLESLNI